MTSKNEMNKPRVVFLTDGYPTAYNESNGIFTHRAIRALSDRIHPKVLHLRAWKWGRTLVVSRKWEGIDVLSIALPQIPSRHALMINAQLICWLGYADAKETLKSAQVIHSTGLFPSGYIASQWAKRLGLPHVAQAIGTDVNSYLPSLSKHTTSKWIYDIDCIVCNSADLSKKLRESFPNLARITVIHRGVDTEFFKPLATNRLGIEPPANMRFLFLGGVQSWNPSSVSHEDFKGGYLLLRAWEILDKNYRNAMLIVGGPGSDVEQMHQWRGKLLHPENVTIVGKVKPYEVPSHICNSDIVVIPSLFEGLPNLAIEAQACGRPVIASDAGGLPESVLDKETGLVFPRGNVESLQQAMEWCLKHPREIASMGMSARNHIRKRFSIQESAARMHEIFRSVSDS